MSQSVPYAMLFSELDMSNVRELEDLLIETMYAVRHTGHLRPLVNSEGLSVR